MLYYINLNAILNHKNKLLLFFLRKKSSNTIFYFHMLFIYLFLSLPLSLSSLKFSLVSLPLHLIIPLSMKARHYQEKKNFNDHLKPPSPQPITTSNPQPTITRTIKTHKQGHQIHPKTKTNPPLTITTLKTHSKTKQNQQSTTKKTHDPQPIPQPKQIHHLQDWIHLHHTKLQQQTNIDHPQTTPPYLICQERE